MDSEQKEWLVDFEKAALYLIAQLPAAEGWRADHFCVEPCPVHGDCIRVILADIVLQHFDYTTESPFAAAEVLVPACVRVPMETVSTGADAG
jgi:hypothetical protein